MMNKIVSRDADDPKLLEFYNTVMDDFARRKRYYCNQRNTALHETHDAAALQRSIGKLEALIFMQKTFHDAWAKLNEIDEDELQPIDEFAQPPADNAFELEDDD